MELEKRLYSRPLFFPEVSIGHLVILKIQGFDATNTAWSFSD